MVFSRRLKKPLSTAQAETPLEQKCLELGVRVTHSRRKIMDVLEKANSHLTVEDIYFRITAETGMALSTVYNNVKDLFEIGVIQRRQFKSKQSYYLSFEPEPQDQFIDIESGRVIEFSSPELDKLKADIAEEYGFSIAECRAEFYSRPCN